MSPALSYAKKSVGGKGGVRRRVAILGSTGSIGLNALDVISRLHDDFDVVALSADSSIDSLAAQARSFSPKIVAVGNERLAEGVKKLMPRGIRVAVGRDGLNEIVSRSDVDMVVMAISGTACIECLVRAIKCGKAIALANKEALVSAGPIIMKLAYSKEALIIPVDSEHSAIFQCISSGTAKASKIYLTGSGGPLLDVPKKDFDRISARRVLDHPKWKMGKKISVDSATMMNKGLEIIEAKYLFGLDESRIEVLIHPEAVIHSMVEFADGAILAQMAVPDMRLPIQYALTYPGRLKSAVKRVDFIKTASLSFREPDGVKFPCLGLARSVARSGGTAPAVLCAADEEAVRWYLEGKIKFSCIPEVIEKVLSRNKYNSKSVLTVSGVLDAVSWAKEETRSICCH